MHSMDVHFISARDTDLTQNQAGQSGGALSVHNLEEVPFSDLFSEYEHGCSTVAFGKGRASK